MAHLIATAVEDDAVSDVSLSTPKPRSKELRRADEIIGYLICQIKEAPCVHDNPFVTHPCMEGGWNPDKCDCWKRKALEPYLHAL